MFSNDNNITNNYLFAQIICVTEWMEAHKTLVTYISLGVVVIIVLVLLLGGLVLACRRWRFPYPCCCVWWRCFQDKDQMRVAAHNLYSAPRTITWGIQRRHESPTMLVGLSYMYQYCKQRGLLCHTVRNGSSAIYRSFKIHFYFPVYFYAEIFQLSRFNKFFECAQLIEVS